MIVIINTGIGNFKSIQNMLLRLGVKSIISDNSDDILGAEKLILPGVGAFDRAMEELHKKNLVDVIKHKCLEEKVKILGICLGMQMFADSSEEGSLKGLSLIKGKVKKFDFMENKIQRKVPHMGWSYVEPINTCFLFQDFELVPRFYFTHSYYFECDNENLVMGKTTYGFEFCTVIQQENIYGVQFHPEKSHRFGMQLLSNFAKC